MTTDIVTYKDNGTGGAPSGASSGLLRRIMGGIPDLKPDARRISVAAPRRAPGAFFHPAAKAEAACTERELTEKNALLGAGGETPALLHYAHLMLECAAKTVSEQAARIAHLEMLATTDELSGLKNRRGFIEAFRAELDRCVRGLSAGGLLVLIDLDNFKAINDTHGHAAGDACIRLVAASLAGDVRLMDTAARLGGDEFVLLLSNTTREKAAGRAQQLAWRLNNLSLAWEGDVIQVRASLGLKSYGPGDSADDIFRAADDDLYERKEARRAASSRAAMAMAREILEQSAL